MSVPAQKPVWVASGVIEITIKKRKGKTRVSYNGSFGVASVYKSLKMLSADTEFRKVAEQTGVSIIDKGNNTDFRKRDTADGFQQDLSYRFLRRTG